MSLSCVSYTVSAEMLYVGTGECRTVGRSAVKVQPPPPLLC